MYAYVILQDDNKFIKSVSDTEQENSIKILVPLNWQRKFFEYPTKFWIDENKTLQGDPNSLPQDDLENLQDTVKSLNSTVNNTDISSLQNTVNTLQKDVSNQPDDSDLKKQVSALGAAVMNLQKQQANASSNTQQTTNK